MQIPGGDYQDIISSGNYESVKKVNIAGVDYPEESLSALKIHRGIFDDSKVTIGSAYEASVELTLISDEVSGKQISEEIPPRARIQVFEKVVGMVNGVQKESVWISQGIFFVDTRSAAAESGSASFNGIDAMVFAEADYPDTSDDWPKTDIAVVEQIAAAMGVEIDEATYDVVTNGYMVQLPLLYTMRETLGHIAAAYAGNFVITKDGKLLLLQINSLPKETDYLIRETGDYITVGTNGEEIVHEYSGNPAVVDYSAGDAKTQEVTLATIDLDLRTDWHGYGSAWVGGDGNNQYDPDSAPFEQGAILESSGKNASATSTYNAYRIRTNGLIDVGAGKSYTISANLPLVYLCYLGANGLDEFIGNSGGWHETPYTFTTPVNTAKLRLMLTKSEDITGASAVMVTPEDFDKLQLQVGSSATAWEPYSNICPIYGYKSALLRRYMGNNLFIGFQTADETLSFFESYLIPVDFSVNESYTFSGLDTSLLGFFSATDGRITTNDGLPHSLSSTVTITKNSFEEKSDNFMYIRLVYVNLSEEKFNLFELNERQRIMCVPGSAAAEYEKGEGSNYSVDFESEAGTVYKGTLDLVSGKLTVDQIGFTFDGTEAWTVNRGTNPPATRFFRHIEQNLDIVSSIRCCSHFKNVSVLTSTTTVGYHAYNPSGSANAWIQFRPNYKNVETPSDWKKWWTDWLKAQKDAGTPVQAVVGLAEPEEYQVPKSVIKLVQGENKLISGEGTVSIEITEKKNAVRILLRRRS